MNRCRIVFGASEEAHISSSALEELTKVASKHSCSLPHMVFTFVLCQLSALPHRSELRSTAASLVGGDLQRCMDALTLEGLASSLGTSPSSTQAPPASTPPPTPLDSLSASWRELTGEHLGATALGRLSAQVCSKYGTLSVRCAPLAAKMFRDLFPNGTFFSFVNDAHRYSQTMDSASVVWKSFSSGKESRERWLSAWTSAKTSCSGDYGADDPYLFVPAANPKFDIENFARLVGTVDIRDALSLSASPSQKRNPPAPSSLTGIGGLK